MNNLKKHFIGVLMGTLVVVCVCACGKNTVQYISSELDRVEESEYTVTEQDGNQTIEEEPRQEISEGICVYVCGAVNAPGVYVLSEGSRVCDAFAAAGGLTEEASKDYWNQARILSDGEMIYVPTEEEAKERAPESSSYENAEEDGKININTASKEELMTLPGIGESKAESIIAYRSEHGKFQSLEDIMEVTGIKEGMYEKIKDYIIIN